MTIADLLTHTAGFEDKFAGTIALQSDSISLASFFARNRPRRVRPAGVEVSYSNIGIALAGYAVQVASGESFDAYVAAHIFAPLGMTHSTFAQPPPADWVKDLASLPPRSARSIAFVPYPAASLVTTPGDMGRFIAAHLSNNVPGAPQILSAEAATDMHASHWRPRPGVPGVAYGFFEGEMNGHRTLFHTGDSGDHSLVLLLPDDGVGFYFVYTGSDEQTVVREKLARAIVDRYFPSAGSSPPAFSGVQNSAGLAGRYRGAAFSRSNYEKLKAMFYQVSVHAGSGGTLLVTPPGGAAPITLRPRAPLVFAGDSGEIVSFRTDANGGIAGFTLSGSIWDPQSFDRISLFQDGRLHIAAFAAVAVALLVRLLYAPVAAVGRRIRGKPRLAGSPAERRWWRLSGIVTVLALLAPVVGLGVAFLSFKPGAMAIPRAAVAVGVWLTLVSLAGLTLVPGAVVAWRHRYWTASRRVVFTAVAVAFLVCAPLLAYGACSSYNAAAPEISAGRRIMPVLA